MKPKSKPKSIKGWMILDDKGKLALEQFRTPGLEVIQCFPLTRTRVELKALLVGGDEIVPVEIIIKRRK